jgi:UDP-glucose 4-epimerase
MAALSNVRSEGLGTEQFRHNTEITRNIIHYGTKFGEPDISFASSSVMYGENSEKPTREDHKTKTTSYYGAGKVASESLLNTYSSQTEGSIKILRMANIVGPRLRDAVIPDFIQKLNKNEDELEILGDGSQTK